MEDAAVREVSSAPPQSPARAAGVPPTALPIMASTNGVAAGELRRARARSIARSPQDRLRRRALLSMATADQPDYGANTRSIH